VLRLAVLASLGASQNIAQQIYPHRHTLGNRAGLHYSHFRAENPKIPIFERESANSG
jgi:hypothetical protein